MPRGLVEPFPVPLESRDDRRGHLQDSPTEAGAAERFARLHGNFVRADHQRNRWLLWDRHRWMPDADAAVIRLAWEFARTWQREAIEIPDRDMREAVTKFVLRLERRDGLTNMLALARAMKPIADAGTQWDGQQLLLGSPNGVVHLRTGALRAGQPDDRITMNTSVAYDPAATCPRWDRFITEIFGGDADLIGFIRRAVGYSLSGDTTQQCLFLLYGTGANGKGTFANTIKRVLGDYAWNNSRAIFGGMIAAVESGPTPSGNSTPTLTPSPSDR